MRFSLTIPDIENLMMVRRLFQFLQAHAKLIRWISVLLIVLAASLVLRTLPAQQIFNGLKDWIDAWGIWGPVVIAAIFVVATIVLLPGWPISVTAGAVFGLLQGVITISIAATISAGAAFLMSRYLFSDIISRRISRFPRVQAIYGAFGRESWKIVVAFRLMHAMPFGLQNYLLGLTEIRFWLYLLISWLLMLPGTLVYVYLGHLGRVGLETAVGGAPISTLQWIIRGVGLILTIAAAYYIVHVARKALRDHAALQNDRELLGPWTSQPETPASAGAPVSVWGTLTLLLMSMVLLAAALSWFVAQMGIAPAPRP